MITMVINSSYPYDWHYGFWYAIATGRSRIDLLTCRISRKAFLKFFFAKTFKKNFSFKMSELRFELIHFCLVAYNECNGQYFVAI